MIERRPSKFCSINEFGHPLRKRDIFYQASEFGIQAKNKDTIKTEVELSSFLPPVLSYT